MGRFNKEPIIIVVNGTLINTERVVYEGYGIEVPIPRGFQSDGPTLVFITRLFITTKEFLLGAKAALIHDYMCKHKRKFSRKISSKMLRDQWVEDGLHPIKGFFLYILVELFQIIEARKEWAD